MFHHVLSIQNISFYKIPNSWAHIAAPRSRHIIRGTTTDPIVERLNNFVSFPIELLPSSCQAVVKDKGYHQQHGSVRERESVNYLWSEKDIPALKKHFFSSMTLW